MNGYARKLSLGIVSAVALSAAGAAGAADMAAPVYKAPPPPPALSWTGFYGGINGGAGWGTTTSDIDVGQTLCLNFSFCTLNLVVPLAQTQLNGFLAGGQIGYNYQMGNYLFGIEGDGDWTNISGTSPCLLVFNCNSKVEWTADIAGRFGFLPIQNLLVYVKGGVTWAGEKDSFGNSISGTFGSAAGPGLNFAGSVNSSFTETRIGGLLGIGTEYAFDPHWRVKIEYNYADYGKHSEIAPVTASGGICSAPCTPGGGSITFPVAVQTQLQVHTVRAGINWAFW